MSLDSLSVFFPAYNEEKNISTTVKNAIKVLESLNCRWEILIINDGSNDHTADEAEKLAGHYKNVRVIHQPNGGYGMALRAGLTNSRYQWILYTDSDGQFDFSEICHFIDKSKDADIIYGYRLKRQDPFYRLWFAKGWKFSLYLFFGLNLRDVDCGFKMIRKEALKKILPFQSTRGAMINAELAIKSKRAGLRIAQVGVAHYPRFSGKPSGASPRVVIQSYKDLLTLWFKLRNQTP